MDDSTKSLHKLESQISRMIRDKSHGSEKPHKLVMLLAIVDLYDKGILTENKIYFNHDLKESFANTFNLIRSERDWNQPAPPFFHLRTSNFWHHKVKPDRKIQYSSLTTSGGGEKRIIENIEYAYLSDYCFDVISNSKTRQELREFLIGALNPYANFSNPAPLKNSSIG